MMAAHDDPGGSNGEILGFGAEKIVSVAEDWRTPSVARIQVRVGTDGAVAEAVHMVNWSLAEDGPPALKMRAQKRSLVEDNDPILNRSNRERRSEFVVATVKTYCSEGWG
jgi:hypothetical protein